MSGLVGAALPTTIRASPFSQLATLAEDFIDPAIWSYALQPVFAAPDAMCCLNWQTPWWPHRGGLLADTGISDVQAATSYGSPYPVSGANGRLGFVGVTRDQYGSPLGNQVVRLIRKNADDSALDEIVAKVTSDANGNFTITTPYNGNHFLTTHHATGVAGASVDTLTPG